jgi:phage repressor protein C with HTH and peptisase S24 domain
MRYQMAVVSGLSMIPTLAPGERILVRLDGPIVLGDIAVFERAGQFEVKRIIRIESEGIFVQGDNDLVSTDSRTYGLIPHEDVIGVATYRLWPKPGRIKQE